VSRCSFWTAALLHRNGETEVTPCPIFLSLVGATNLTKVIFNELSKGVSSRFPEHRTLVLPDPFKDYSSLRIGKKRKREYSPEARVCFRWGLFYEFINENRAAFLESDIVLVPRFGYDLYRGAVGNTNCQRALDMHVGLVQHGVLAMGLCPPLYLFTEEVSAEEVVVRRAYFEHPGQHFVDVENSGRRRQVNTILELIAKELDERAQTSSAA
jgi:hypothetical protein